MHFECKYSEINNFLSGKSKVPKSEGSTGKGLGYIKKELEKLGLTAVVSNDKGYCVWTISGLQNTEAELSTGPKKSIASF